MAMKAMEAAKTATTMKRMKAAKTATTMKPMKAAKTAASRSEPSPSERWLDQLPASSRFSFFSGDVSAATWDVYLLRMHLHRLASWKECFEAWHSATISTFLSIALDHPSDVIIPVM